MNDFETRREAQDSEALADVLNGTVIALFAIIFALVMLLVVAYAMLIQYQGRLHAREEELVTKTAALVSEQRLRSEAEARLVDAWKQKKELAAKAKATADSTQMKQTDFKAATDELARLAGELTKSRDDALKLQRQLDVCKSRSMGDERGSMVNSGFRIFEDYPDAGQAIITEAMPQTGGYWQHYICRKQEKMVSTSYGGGNVGSPIGR